MVNTIKIEKVTKNNSFNLWRINICALLKEQGISAFLSGQSSKVDKSILELQDEKAHSLILLLLSNQVLHKVSEEKIASALWLKLEKLFTTKSIYNELLLKWHLFGLHTREGTPLKEHLDELNSLMELRDIDVKIKDEDLTMILLASPLLSYENFVSSLSVGKDSITLEEFKYNLYSIEL